MRTPAGDGHLEAVEEECELLSQGGAGKGSETGPVPRDAGVGQGGARENSSWSSRLPEGRKREGGMRDENVTCHRAIKVCHEAGIVGKP